MKILVIGGGGYVGSVLVNSLLKENYTVVVYDLFLFGNHLEKNKNLIINKGDIRDLKSLKNSIIGIDIIIHLACISNDPSFELDPELGKKINYDCFLPLIKLSKDQGVSKFIYASSSSVYGINNKTDIDENTELKPLTDYSKYKALCEEILLKYSAEDFKVIILRPATVCGVSPRMRLDLIVNILTNLAFHKREITIFGGNQLRPNIHIDDIVNAYLYFVKKLFNQELSNNFNIYNVGFENLSVLELAELTKSVVGKDVSFKKIETNDNRSYHISSKKIIQETKFRTKKTIKNAIEDLKLAFENQTFTHSLDNSIYYNIKQMQKIKLS